IEGGFKVVGGVWSKDLSSATTITFDGPMLTTTVGPATVGFYIGLNLISRINVTFTDLTLSVKPGGASGTFNNRGISIYTARLQNCQNIAFNRVTFVRSNASGGANGTLGATGSNGSDAVSGLVGSADNATACGKGGAGGAGGG